MPGTTEQEIVALEEYLAQATRTLDIDALNHMYADDIMMTGVLGEPTCTKSAILDEAKRGVAQRESAVAAGKQCVASYDNEDLKIVFSGDTAVTNYRFVVTIKGGSVDAQRRYRTTNVWMKRHGRWQVVAAHTAFILDPKQAAVLAGEAG